MCTQKDKFSRRKVGKTKLALLAHFAMEQLTQASKHQNATTTYKMKGTDIRFCCREGTVHDDGGYYPGALDQKKNLFVTNISVQPTDIHFTVCKMSTALNLRFKVDPLKMSFYVKDVQQSQNVKCT